MRNLIISAAALAATALIPTGVLACACGCGVFDVGAGTFMPSGDSSGFTAWFRFNYMNQHENWEGDGKAPSSDNQDKALTTRFYTFGGQYMINRKWTVMAELPIFSRDFTSTDDGTVFGPAGDLYHAHITSLGDLQVTALYTGFADDLSSGLGLGLKLPTGDWHGPNGPLGGPEFDRDSLPGTGSTDLMITGYHVGALGRGGALTYFVQGKYDVPFAIQDHYRPGDELDAAAGITYDLGSFGRISKIAPVLQLVDSYRVHDTGANADPLNSGYERLMVSPGMEVRLNRVRVFADVALPVYQHTNAAPSLAIEQTSGQLVAPALFSVQASYSF